jgi:hypothetical protein
MISSGFSTDAEAVSAEMRCEVYRGKAWEPVGELHFEAAGPTTVRVETTVGWEGAPMILVEGECHVAVVDEEGEVIGRAVSRRLGPFFPVGQLDQPVDLVISVEVDDSQRAKGIGSFDCYVS